MPFHPRYRGTPPINDRSDIVGWYTDTANITHGYLRTREGHLRTLENEGHSTNQAQGINNKQEIVGVRLLPNSQEATGYLYVEGIYTPVLVPGAIDTRANGINDWGDIVGQYTDPGGAIHGFLYSDGMYTTLDYPGADLTAATGINNQGRIVGYHQTDASGSIRQGFVYINGRYRLLNSPTATILTQPNGISNNNWIAGEQCCPTAGWIFRQGKFETISVPESGPNFATGINRQRHLSGIRVTLAGNPIRQQGYIGIPVD